MTETILFSLEESGTRGVEYVLNRAQQRDGSVHALAVVDTARYGEPALSSGEVVVDEAEDRATERLRAFVARARDRGIPVETARRHGRLAEQLPAYADEVDANVVVCPRRIPHGARRRLERTAETVVAPLEEPAVA